MSDFGFDEKDPPTKNTSAVALCFSSKIACETNRVLSAFGKCLKKLVYAFSFAITTFFPISGASHHFAIII